MVWCGSFSGLQLIVDDTTNSEGYSDDLIALQSVGIPSDSAFTSLVYVVDCISEGATVEAPCGKWLILVFSLDGSTVLIPTGSPTVLIELQFQDTQGNPTAHPDACLYIENVAGCFVDCDDASSCCSTGSGSVPLVTGTGDFCAIPPMPPPASTCEVSLPAGIPMLASTCFLKAG